MNLRINGGTIFTFLFLFVVIGALLTSREWSIQARLFPWTIGIPALVLCLIQLFLDLRRPSGRAGEQPDKRIMDLQVDRDVPLALVARRATMIFGWIFGIFAAVWLFGFIITLPLFVWAYMTLQSGEKWWFGLAWGVATFLFIVGVFHYTLKVPWPAGYIEQPQEILLSWLGH